MKMKTSIALLGVVLATGWLGPACGGGSTNGGTPGSGGTTGTPGSAGASGRGGSTGSGGSGPAGTTGVGGQAGTGMTCAPLTQATGVSTVNGPAVGPGLHPNSALKKAIRATDTGSNPTFAIGNAWILAVTDRSTFASRSSGTGMIAVTNRSTAPICNVMMSNFAYRDAAGNNLNSTIAAPNYAYVTSGTGMQCTGLYQPINDCLAPGETGWAFNSLAFTVAMIATTPIVSADFTISGMTGVGDAQPDFKVAATSYSVDAVDTSTPQPLHVTVQNTGTKLIAIGSLITFLLLDEQGLPAYFSSISVPNGTQNLMPGQSVTVTQNQIQFDGSSTRVQFFVQAHYPN